MLTLRCPKQVVTSLTLFLSIQAPIWAQESSLRSPEDAVRILQGPQTDDQVRLAKQLHIEGGLAGREFEVSHRQLERGLRTAVITNDDGMQDFLVIVLKRTKQAWSYSDSMHFASTYDRLSFDLKPLTAPPLSDIVVHQHVTGHGTGFYEGHFLVIKLINGKLRLVLDAIEEARSLGWPGQQDIEQKSVFKLHPASKDEEASIEEEETVKSKFIEEREQEFRWEPMFNIFESSPWCSAEKNQTGK